jgi:hypothetical protein
LDSSSSVCSSDSVKKHKSSDLSTPLYQRSALDDLYTVSDKAKFVQNQGETIAYKKDSNTQIYESAMCKRKSMMVKSKEVIGEDAFVEIPNNNKFSIGLHYSENINAKDSYVPQGEYISIIDEKRGNEFQIQNFITVGAEDCRSPESDMAESDLIPDDSSMYNEVKLAKLASIDELIEYEEEIGNLA